MPAERGGPVTLAVRGLSTVFELSSGRLPAVRDLDLDIRQGEIVTVVGESGSGKSVTALSIMRLIQPPGRIEAGSVRLHDTELLDLPPRAMQAVRGRRIGMIFQNPYAALHPYFRVGHQMEETLVLRTGLDRRRARTRAVGLLERIQVPSPETVLHSFPFEISAGVCQRVMLAMALCADPELLIADEPTTNLDGLAQVEILDLIKRMRDDLGMAVMLITHDFGVVSRMADSVLVMYAGRPVEYGPADAVMTDPEHPYTEGLVRSARTLVERRPRLDQIPGEVPDILDLPAGCSFAPRCPYAAGLCREDPPMMPGRDGRLARCWRLDAVRWAEAGP
ncbi:MAG: ABC transporter ATP-binding protein [Azospirillaceae bacterium]